MWRATRIYRKYIHSKNNKKEKKVLTSLGFSRRCLTIVRRNSSWEILIPLIRSSCSESAKNMQFPSPWLSEIAKPFSNAVLFKACDSLVLLDSMRASRMICWSAIKKGSPVNGKWKKINVRLGLFHASSIGDGALVWSSKQQTISAKITVVSKELNDFTLLQNIFWLWFDSQSKQWHYLPSVLMQHPFQSHSVERHLLGFFQHL